MLGIEPEVHKAILMSYLMDNYVLCIPATTQTPDSWSPAVLQFLVRLEL